MATTDLPFLITGCVEADMGQLAEILPAQRRIFAPRRGRKHSIEFNLEKHSGLIVLGDGKDWATHVNYARERGWLQMALENGRLVLGICHGAQLLAAFLNQQSDGKALSKTRTEEHCGVLTPVALEGEGKIDPVVSHLNDGTPVVQAHGDSFQCPARATALGWSKKHTIKHCEAFRLGSPENAVYGLQFHPEPTVQMLQSESEKDGWFDTIPPREELDQAVKAGEKILRAWVDLASARVFGSV